MKAKNQMPPRIAEVLVSFAALAMQRGGQM